MAAHGQARYWMLTVAQASEAYALFPPTEQCLADTLVWCKGQQEQGLGGLMHWQVVIGFSKPTRIAKIQRLYPGAHAEPTRSSAADDYVWKEDTRVPGSQFEFGRKPLRRNEPNDWVAIRESAKAGTFEDIPADVYVRNYSSIRRIASDNSRAIGMVRTISVRWGPTGTGKSRSAWNEAGMDAYPKCPSTKWWDGYRDHRHVVIDEFCGSIGISHLLRWFDRYPVNVEYKGGSTPLVATHIWITSNINPDHWFPEATIEQQDAIRRRYTTIENVTVPIIFE